MISDIGLLFWATVYKQKPLKINN